MNKLDLVITVAAFALLTIAPSFAERAADPDGFWDLQLAQAGDASGGAGAGGGGARVGAGAPGTDDGAAAGNAGGQAGTSAPGAAPSGSDADATNTPRPGTPPKSNGAARAIDESTGPTSGQTERDRRHDEGQPGSASDPSRSNDR